MLYPISFKPVYKEKIWGGNTLNQKFQRDIPSNRTGESWDVACHENGMSVVVNGELKDKTLEELIQIYGKDLLGTSIYNDSFEKFPLLVKLLDATDILSIQVHPDDGYAHHNEDGEYGKTEMWYIIDAKPDSYLIYGVKDGVTKEEFKKSIEDGTLEECVSKLYVRPGDVVFIPAGMIHAIGSGILLCEVQQNSDTTYRVYDFNRTDSDGNKRELHVDKALDVIDFDGKFTKQTVSGLRVDKSTYTREYLVACDQFAAEKIDIHKDVTEHTKGEKFHIITALCGNAVLEYKEGRVDLKPGETYLIPASIFDYTIKGLCTILKSYVPDINNDIIRPLRNEGIDEAEIDKIAGI